MTRSTHFAGMILACGSFLAAAQTGPFNPENWPPTVVADKMVHYVATDGSFAPPGPSWVADGL